MYTIEVQYLDETIAKLEEIDKRLSKELVREIKSVTTPTLTKAKSYAHLGLFSTGSYARSLSIRTYAHGVKFTSTDPGGGVIEFANPGATILSGPRAGRRAGVPHGSTPPRALLKAILEDEESIVEHVNSVVIKACDFQIGV